MKDVCWALGPRGCLRTVFVIGEMIGNKKLGFFTYQIVYFSWPAIKDKSPLLKENNLELLSLQCLIYQSHLPLRLKSLYVGE